MYEDLMYRLNSLYDRNLNKLRSEIKIDYDLDRFIENTKDYDYVMKNINDSYRVLNQRMIDAVDYGLHTLDEEGVNDVHSVGSILESIFYDLEGNSYYRNENVIIRQLPAIAIESEKYMNTWDDKPDGMTYLENAHYDAVTIYHETIKEVDYRIANLCVIKGFMNKLECEEISEDLSSFIENNSISAFGKIEDSIYEISQKILDFSEKGVSMMADETFMEMEEDLKENNNLSL